MKIHTISGLYYVDLNGVDSIEFKSAMNGSLSLSPPPSLSLSLSLFLCNVMQGIVLYVSHVTHVIHVMYVMLVMVMAIVMYGIVMYVCFVMQ